MDPASAARASAPAAQSPQALDDSLGGLSDNRLELTVRFHSPNHGTREIKGAMCREILAEVDAAGIGIASATYEITALPTIALSHEEGGG